MKQGWWWVGGLTLVAAAAGIWSITSKGASWTAAGAASAASAKASAPGLAASAPPLEFQSREIVRPVWAPMPVSLTFSGPLTAPSTVTVRAKVSGTLQSLTVQEGSRVRAGQVIGRVDAADAASRVAERGAMLESARAALAQAERTLRQNESLAAQRFIAPAAVDSSRSAVETAQAQLSAAQAALASTQVALAEAAIVSPIAGIVSKRHVLPGEKIGMEQQVVTIVDLRELELLALVPTHEVGRLEPGMAVQIAVEGVEGGVSGRIARIAPAAEPGSRAIGVAVTVPNARERFRAGQFAVAKVEVADSKPRLVLPETAISSSGGQHQVWALEGGVLRRRSVTLGRQDAATGRVEVLDGLPADAQVLAARYDNLRDGGRAVVAAAAASR